MKLEIEFGVLAPSIKEQLRKSGFSFKPKTVEFFDRRSQAITALLLGDIISQKQANKMRDKLFTQIAEHVKDLKTLK